MEVVIADDSKHEDLYADISYKDLYWGRVTYDSDIRKFKLEIFFLPNEDGYEFILSEAQQALERAKRRLTELGYIERDD